MPTFLGKETTSSTPRWMQGIADLGANLLGKNRPKMGENIPETPNLQEDPTGIAGPGADEPQSVAELGQANVDAHLQEAEDRLAAEEADKDLADETTDEFRSDKEDIVGEVGEAREDLAETEADFEDDLQETSDNLQDIPEEVTREFDRIRDEFGEAGEASFDRVDSKYEDASAEATRGRTAAMQAAVQGIQGNVNTQVAQIMSNPNLTQSQKQSMVSQVRMAGASSLAPAIGATILQFNELSAGIAMKFGEITGNLEANILSGEAQLGGIAGQAFAQARVATGQMANTLLEISANASVAFANTDAQLLGVRTQATMSGNQLLLNMIPEQSTPYFDPTGASQLAFDTGINLMMDQFKLDMGTAGMDLLIASLESSRGNPLSNMLLGAIEGFAQGGRGGAAMGAAGGFFGSF